MIKMFMIMKLTTIFMLTVCLNASANGFSQKVSLNETNSPLDKVFKEIKKQSDYTFVYTKALLKKANTVTVNINGTARPIVYITNTAGSDCIWYTADDGLRLASGSVCINAGTPDTTGLNIGSIDITSATRLSGTAIDIGAYEYDIIPLPLTLISFSGSLQNGMAALQWHSENESDFKKFEIEKSTDGAQFLRVGEVPAKGSGGYAYSVLQPEPVAYYRLKMVDINGSTTNSRFIRLTQKTGNNLFVYPNPAARYINIQVASAGKISLYAENGILVKTVTVQPGINTIAIDELGAGVYFIRANEQQALFIKK